jgi:hypothetical protein
VAFRSNYSANIFKFYVSTPIIVIENRGGGVKMGGLLFKMLLILLNYKELTVIEAV